MPELVGLERLKKKLKSKQPRVETRYRYYDMKATLSYRSPEIPAQLACMASVLGWCGTAVDSLADRLVFREFKNDAFDLTGIYQMNNMDIIFDSAILAALIGACSFIYIVPDDNTPRMRVLDAYNATGTIDPVTHMLMEGYAVLERDVSGSPTIEAYFLPESTTYYPKGGKAYAISHRTPYCLLVPVIYRPDATRAFGHSRIKRSCIGLTQMAMRAVFRSDIASEFYSYPQRYVLGMDPEAEKLDKWRAIMTSMLRIDKDEEGQTPSIGQFPQQSMAPYADLIRMIAGLFAGETGLTLDDLGLASQSPASPDAIRSAHEQLRLTARKAQRTFGTCFLNAGYLAACVRDDYPYLRQQLYMTQAVWEPLFEPDASQLSGIGDAVNKIQQSFPDYFDEDKLREMTGI